MNENVIQDSSWVNLTSLGSNSTQQVELLNIIQYTQWTEVFFFFFFSENESELDKFYERKSPLAKKKKPLSLFLSLLKIKRFTV